MGNFTKLVPKMWKFSPFRNEYLTLQSIQLILPFMKRDIYQQLIEWKQSELRKPLILRGARQVGKTYILLEFAKKEYENYIYLNFEDDPNLDALFSQRFDKEKIITGLSIYGGGVKVLPGSTLIIFDEIQASNNALNSLKYFNERAKEYHIAAAGSLLGIKLGGQRSFPVGQVTFLDLYPATFLEFLNAVGKPELRGLIESANKDFESFPEPFHVELIEQLKYYYFTGGMPEAVSVYCKTRSYNISRPGIPLMGYANENIFKVYLLDIGLLGAMVNISPAMLIDGNAVFTHFYGAFVENYAAQQLRSKFPENLFYWSSQGKAEVDFVYSVDDRVYPLETKAGLNLLSKSLKVYNEKYDPVVVSRSNLSNLRKDGKTCNYPLYAISLFPLCS